MSNRSKQLLAAVVLCVAGVAVYFSFIRNARSAPRTPTAVPQSWYTTDDGKTWFAADSNKLSPFTHEGKQAYRCYVWSCDGGKTKFVSHLERHKPPIHQQFQSRGKVDAFDVPPGMTEVKPAHSADASWVQTIGEQAAQIQSPRCPDGRPGAPQPVYPDR